MTKITIIGAGSGMFSVNLIRDLCLTPRLAGSTICFMDINQQRLDAVHDLCVRYAQAVGIYFEFTKTTNRREALSGADFVINTALAAGHDRLQKGMEVAHSYGYRMGGSLRIMHDEAFWINFYQYHLMEDILIDILEVCPEAYYIIVSNPVVGGITYLGRKYPQAKIVGMCHGFSGVYPLAEVLGIARENLSFSIPGVNHFVWLNGLYDGGQDKLPELARWVDEQADQYCAENQNYYINPKSIDIYRRFGVFPIGDTVTPGGGAWGWWYHSNDDVQSSWREDPQEGLNAYFQWVDSQAKKVARAASDPTVDLLAEIPREMSGEPMVPLIEALACGVERVVTVNVMNTMEYVAGIPRDFEVECLASCGARGIQPLTMKPLPRQIVSLALRDVVALVNMELEAFETGSYDLLLAMILMDPFTRSEKQARELLDAILDLPFNHEMKVYFCKS